MASAMVCRQRFPSKPTHRAGFRSKDGLLRRVVNNNGVYSLGSVVPTRTERELFEIIDLPWVEPVDREFP